MTTRAFQKHIRSWYKKNGRHDLPWRPPSLKLRKDNTLDPYHILVSEVMLQQTQVARAIPKYHEFLKAFPTIQHIAGASNARVLTIWQGMGYNRRALNLKQAAERILKEFGGKIPDRRAALESLPGIGPGTAGAVLAFAFGKRIPFIETNIRRIYLHFFFSSKTGVDDSDILKKIEATLPPTRSREWYWALMDYGALRFKSIPNPNTRSKHYAHQSAFKGSRRELRGKIIDELIREKKLPQNELEKRLLPIIGERKDFSIIVKELAKEGFITIAKGAISLSR